jgi:hypothetical protein
VTLDAFDALLKDCEAIVAGMDCSRQTGDLLPERTDLEEGSCLTVF